MTERPFVSKKTPSVAKIQKWWPWMMPGAAHAVYTALADNESIISSKIKSRGYGKMRFSCYRITDMLLVVEVLSPTPSSTLVHQIYVDLQPKDTRAGKVGLSTMVIAPRRRRP